MTMTDVFAMAVAVYAQILRWRSPAASEAQIDDEARRFVSNLQPAEQALEKVRKLHKNARETVIRDVLEELRRAAAKRREVFYPAKHRGEAVDLAARRAPSLFPAQTAGDQSARQTGGAAPAQRSTSGSPKLTRSQSERLTAGMLRMAIREYVLRAMPKLTPKQHQEACEVLAESGEGAAILRDFMERVQDPAELQAIRQRLGTNRKRASR